MNFLASTMLSGVTYDLIKVGMKLTANFLKEKLKDWILKEEDYEKLAETINTAAEIEENKKNEECWEAFLDSNETINTILERAQKAENNSMVQNFSNASIQNSGIIANKIESVTINNSDDSKKK